MAEGAGAAGGRGGPGGPGMGDCRGFRGRFCNQGQVMAQAEAAELARQDPGQGMDPHHQTGPPGQGYEDQGSLEEIYLFSLPLTESGIIDFSLEASLKDKMLIIPVQMQPHIG